MGRHQQIDEAEHAGNLRRALPSSQSTAVLMALFPTLRGMGRRRQHMVLVKLLQQRSDPVQQRVSAQERGCLISQRSMGRTAEERRQGCCQRRLESCGKGAGTTQTAQRCTSMGLWLR